MASHASLIDAFRALDLEQQSGPDRLQAHHPPQHSQTQAAPVQQAKSNDFVLKFLLVGDSDVGKEEILHSLEDDGEESAETYRSLDVAYKSTNILLYGKRVKLRIWNTSGQGRFSTVIHSYSRGAQGIILVYDITNKWSFNGLDRWLQEIDQHAPGVPKILVGNRKHLAFRRQVSEKHAKSYAQKHNMAFLEVSPLCNFNIQESCAELSRLVLERNGMEDFWTNSTMLSLQDLCNRKIVSHVNPYDIDSLPLPTSMKSHLRSFSSPITAQSNFSFEKQLEALKKQKSKQKRFSWNFPKLLLFKKRDKNNETSSRSKLRRLFSFNSTNSQPVDPPSQSKRIRQSCTVS